MSDIILPNEWEARHYQKKLFEYMFANSMEDRRAVEVWHRRAGKDSTSLNFEAMASQHRVGTIWHMLPTLNQGRKVIWDGIDKYGRRMIDQAFPKEMRASTNNSEMQIKFKNGSMWQVVGSDNYDSLVGTNPIGVVFSEWSVADPRAWDFIRPILAENGGWAIFIYTPRGKNHGHSMHEMARDNPKWFYSLLTVEDTLDETGNPIISQETIQDERDAGMSEQMIQQEFYCSFDTGLVGAYYTDILNKAEKEKRIGDFPWMEDREVLTIWDLGMRDDNSIGFYQYDDNGYIRMIDHLSGSGRSMAEWIKICRDLPYVYYSHTGPHDLKNREYTSGYTREEVAASLGFRFDYAPKVSMTDGINAVRQIFGKLRINKPNCSSYLDSMYNYRREYDEKNQVFKERPLHDWSSHDADMTRYFAVSWVDSSVIYGASALVRRGSRKFKVKKAIGR